MSPEAGPRRLAAMKTSLQVLFCLAAGVLGSSGFGSFRGSGWMVPVLALAVLFANLQGASARRAAGYALVFGLGYFAVGLNWVHSSLYNYGGVSLVLAHGIATWLALVLALFYAAAAALAARLGKGRMPVAQMTCLCGSWVMLEHLRSWLFGGFGWLAAGYAQVSSSPLAGYVPVIGVFGATALCALVAGLLALALVARSNWRIAALLVPVAALLAGGAALRRVSYVSTAGEAFAVSVLQGRVPQDEQWLKKNVARTPRLYYDLASQAQGKLIVAPESALPFVWDELPETIRRQFGELLAAKDAALVLGAFGVDKESGNEQNIAVILHAGKRQVYAKRQLTPYGEYLPLANLLEPLLERNQIPFSSLAPGSGDGVVELPWLRMAMSICYESLFPWLHSAPPAQVLVNITNDSWFDTTVMPYQHLQIAAGRALENQRWMIRASNTGPSALIRPDGRIYRRKLPLVRGVLEGVVAPLQGSTPYARFGDWPVLLAALLALLPLHRLRRAKN